MTTFSTNTHADLHADLNARGRQMLKNQAQADAQVWSLTDMISAFVVRMRPDPEQEIAKAARREAARRAVDNLLR